MAYQNIHQDIIDKCINGDTKAQFEIYKLYYKAMYNTCLRIIQNRMDAEDVMQEAFLSAFNRISTYKAEVSFGAWLKKIVINRSLDHMKKNRPDFTDVLDDQLDINNGKDETDNLDVLNIKVNKIKEAINLLPDGYRVVLSLFLLEGFDHDEIAGILNITSSTSRSQYSRAKKKLIEQIKLYSFSPYEKN